MQKEIGSFLIFVWLLLLVNCFFDDASGKVYFLFFCRKVTIMYLFICNEQYKNLNLGFFLAFLGMCACAKM